MINVLYACEFLLIKLNFAKDGNPEISTDYMLDGWDISTQESSIIEILHEQGAKLFPPIVFSNVDRIPPELEPWKKALLEDLLSLQAIIVGKYNIDIGKTKFFIDLKKRHVSRKNLRKKTRT